jgi:LPS-assembly protein
MRKIRMHPHPYQNLTENSVLIEGDSLESILDRKLRATGNASILKGNQSITADFIEYDQISEELYAKGSN